MDRNRRGGGRDRRCRIALYNPIGAGELRQYSAGSGRYFGTRRARRGIDNGLASRSSAGGRECECGWHRAGWGINDYALGYGDCQSTSVAVCAIIQGATAVSLALDASARMKTAKGFTRRSAVDGYP